MRGQGYNALDSYPPPAKAEAPFLSTPTERSARCLTRFMYKRTYVFFLDLKGMLHNDTVRTKTNASALKHAPFVDFFFRRLKKNKTTDEFSEKYPFVSFCGAERNLLRCADTPIVFHEYQQPQDAKPAALCYAATLLQEFDVSRLCVCRASGRLYHAVDALPGQSGLLASSLAEKLCVDFGLDMREDGSFVLTRSHSQLVLPWKDT